MMISGVDDKVVCDDGGVVDEYDDDGDA